MESKRYIQKWHNRSDEEVDQKADVILHFKSYVDPEVSDQMAKQATIEAYKEIDCLDCGNCCRTSVTDFSLADVKKAAKFLGISKKAFIKKYLMEDMDGAYVTITSPCPFLNLSDNKCTIYEARPYVCDSYPHTQKSGFNQRKHAHTANLDMCPITYRVVEKMEALIKK